MDQFWKGLVAAGELLLELRAAALDGGPPAGGAGRAQR